MIDKNRIDKVYRQLEKIGVEQMIISDPVAIFYMTGKWIFPGERFLGLLIKKGSEPVLFLNELFSFAEDCGAKKVYFTDTDFVINVIRPFIDSEKILGVDKNLTANFLLAMIESNIAKNFCNASIAIDSARAIKDEAEREKMRISSNVNDMAMDEFKKLLRDGVTELEVAESMLGIYKKLGASRYSFDPIVAFGKNAADGHHMPDNTALKEGDGVLFDVGCVVNEYCSDMTRCFFWKKEPTAIQKEVYNLVRSANEEAEKMLRAGIKLQDIDKKARDIITEGGHGSEFTHRLGHFIGIEDHEFGDVSMANENLTQAGNVFSIEPGIYIPEVVGVRIEDLALITEDGCEILNNYSKEIEVLG